MPPKFTKVACGGSHSLGIQEDGTLVQWGSAMPGFRPMKALDIACSKRHSVAIDKETGLVHQWGPQMKGFEVPTMKLKAVAATRYGSFFGLQEDNTLVEWHDKYASDINKTPGLKLRSISTAGGNLLYGIRDDGTIVRIGDMPSWDLPNETARFITGNERLAVAILEDGTLKQWGDGVGQPPPGRFLSVSVYSGYPDKVNPIAVRDDGKLIEWGGNATTLPDIRATQVFCGPDWWIAIQQDGELYAWGDVADKVVFADFPGTIGTVPPPRPVEAPPTFAYDPPKFLEGSVPTTPSVNGLQTRSSASFKEHQVTILPKGTLLFRGVRDASQFDDDVMGLKILDLKDARKPVETCLSPFYTVYFYPFPFADAFISDFSHYGVYVTTRDMTLLCLISPSKMTRGDRHTADGPTTTCATIDGKTLGCGILGRPYDACLKPTFLAEFPDVVGTLAIANEDRNAFQTILQNKDGMVAKSLGTYVFPYLDAGDKEKQGGIPEIVLHPFNRALQVAYKTIRVPLSEFIGTHKEHLNYQPLVVLKRTDEAILNLMKGLTSPAGFTIDASTAPVHAKINPSTGFFQLVELSDPASLDPSQPFRFVRATTPGATTGSGRGKTRRLRRGERKQTRKGMIQ